MTLPQKIENLLFIAGKPLTVKKLAELTKTDTDRVISALGEMTKAFDEQGRGLQIMRQGQSIQMSTHPDAAKLVEDFVKAEQFGELTKPSLESLTIIAYRGPITKPELEAVRGVNCSLILRNLLIKGLIESHDNATKLMTEYSVTFDFMRYLGLKDITDLPSYQELRNNAIVDKLLAMDQEGDTDADAKEKE